MNSSGTPERTLKRLPKPAREAIERGKALLRDSQQAVEAGDPFLDRETRKGPVVYINYEMPLDYFVSLANADPIPENFYVGRMRRVRL